MDNKRRFGFILTTNLGNITRFENLRKFAGRYPDIECIWAAVDYRPEPTRVIFLANKILPSFLYWRFVAIYQSRSVLCQFWRMDTVMVHQFESSIILTLLGYLTSSTMIVNSSDDTPLVGLNGHPMYPNELNRSPFTQKLRLKLDLWRARRANFNIPMSNWAGKILTGYCGVDAMRVRAIPVGLDLEKWPLVTNVAKTPGTIPRVLFVGGDFERKGGLLLLELHQRLNSDKFELHIVSKSPVEPNLKNVFIYDEISPGDVRLSQLYIDCDVFVLPTYSDISPWVCLEAMACSRPVISTRVGAISDMVIEGDTGFLIDKGDALALEDAVMKILGNPTLAAKMGAAGRTRVEAEFNASINVPLILKQMGAK